MSKYISLNPVESLRDATVVSVRPSIPSSLLWGLVGDLISVLPGGDECRWFDRSHLLLTVSLTVYGEI